MECVDTTIECVDTLSYLRKTGLLDAGSSVDTTRDCVDTLSQSGNWVSCELGLTRLDLLLDQHCCNHELLLFFSFFFSFFFPWRCCSAPLDASPFFPLFFPSSRMLLALSCVGYFGVQETWVFIAPYVHKKPWGTWAQNPRKIPLDRKRPRVQINSHFFRFSQSVSTLPLSVSTHCPICAKRGFWMLGLVSTLPGTVSTPCPSQATGSPGNWV
ncbi:hypothetical protein Taro_039999 [Colocasia esculenta]|uniref:Uncharacterized protein n=1 Tax=Colocasia esculenta TaxID=4460 RepID=A0A843W7U6_COLES|nr:hypothetical protein [Colocasia esculenta]